MNRFERALYEEEAGRLVLRAEVEAEIDRRLEERGKSADDEEAYNEVYSELVAEVEQADYDKGEERAWAREDDGDRY